MLEIQHMRIHVNNESLGCNISKLYDIPPLNVGEKFHFFFDTDSDSDYYLMLVVIKKKQLSYQALHIYCVTLEKIFGIIKLK